MNYIPFLYDKALWCTRPMTDYINNVTYNHFGIIIKLSNLKRSYIFSKLFFSLTL